MSTTDSRLKDLRETCDGVDHQLHLFTKEGMEFVLDELDKYIPIDVSSFVSKVRPGMAKAAMERANQLFSDIIKDRCSAE